MSRASNVTIVDFSLQRHAPTPDFCCHSVRWIRPRVLSAQFGLIASIEIQDYKSPKWQLTPNIVNSCQRVKPQGTQPPLLSMHILCV